MYNFDHVDTITKPMINSTVVIVSVSVGPLSHNVTAGRRETGLVLSPLRHNRDEMGDHEKHLDPPSAQVPIFGPLGHPR